MREGAALWVTKTKTSLQSSAFLSHDPQPYRSTLIWGGGVINGMVTKPKRSSAKCFSDAPNSPLPESGRQAESLAIEISRWAMKTLLGSIGCAELKEFQQIPVRVPF